MKKYIVIYTSKRGSTKQYAEWIAEDLGCEALPLSDAQRLDLHEYDCVIYGGWIRGSGIVNFDKFAKMLDADIMDHLLVFGVGFADETADNYAQVWGYSLGKIDPKNEHRVLMYILGGRYDPAAVTGLDRFLMKTMRAVLLSGSTKDSKSQANMMKERIDNGCDIMLIEANGHQMGCLYLPSTGTAATQRTGYTTLQLLRGNNVITLRRYRIGFRATVPRLIFMH